VSFWKPLERRVFQLRDQRPHPDRSSCRRDADNRRRAARATHRRDDSGSFRPPYAELEICRTKPCASIDQAGVGQLMKIAVEKGNATRPGIKLGICGEDGGDPNSVFRSGSGECDAICPPIRRRNFCHKIGLTYLSAGRQA
jgi:hypothetical protein